MEEENRKLGELTLEEFAAIFETSAKDQKSKSGIRRNQLKSSIKTDGNKGKIIAIIQPLLEIYDALSDTKPEQGTLERIKAVWPDIREKTPYSSGADIYFGESIVKDDSKYMRKIKEELENVKESTVKEISNILINFSEENGKQHLSNCLELYRKMGINIYIKKGEGNMEESKDNKVKEELEDLISNGATQIILTGAPGTGKTRMAKEIAKEIAKECECGEKLNDKNYEFVQFHPSYDYTDFVEGLRPIEDKDKDKDGNTTMVFRKVDGIFKKFCRDVAVQNKEDKKNKKKKYFFLIDEINRADLSKVFGELMFCLETDKRGKGNAVQTQYQNLPTYDVKEKKYYGENEDIFANGFYIPENVIIIGTMNDIDRSVESMDFALRRRFIWKEVEVTRDLLKNSLKGILGEYKEKYKCNFECNKVAEVIADSIMNLNNEKLKDNPNFGKHYFISQGQFANLPGNIINQAIDAGEKAEDKTEAIAKSLISSVWDLRLESLLYEYIRGEGDEQDFVEECKKALESREEKESTQA